MSSDADPSTQPEADARDERRRIEKVNEWRAARRGYLVFATDPDRAPGEPGYRDVYATEARTRNEATAKVRAFTGGRRLRVFLAAGRYRAEFPNARWIPQWSVWTAVWIVSPPGPPAPPGFEVVPGR